MSQFQDFGSIFSVAGKTAVVTGGSRGLGLHAATGLLHGGCTTLIITSRKADACDEAVKALKGIAPKATVLAIPADLAKPAEVTRFVEEVQKAVDHVDILIANAGATWGEKLETHADAAFAKVMDLNVRSVFNLIREMTPLLSAKATLEDPSRIITVGSIAGIQVGNTGENATFGYTASKAAVHHLTKHMASELGPRHILCNAIAPGFFVSKMSRGLIELEGGVDAQAKSTPNGRLGRPEDIGGIVVWLCSRAGSHVNGAVLPIDGGRHLVTASKI